MPRLSRGGGRRPPEFSPPLAGESPCAGECGAAGLRAASGESPAGPPPGDTAPSGHPCAPAAGAAPDRDLARKPAGAVFRTPWRTMLRALAPVGRASVRQVLSVFVPLHRPVAALLLAACAALGAAGAPVAHGADPVKPPGAKLANDSTGTGSGEVFPMTVRRTSLAGEAEGSAKAAAAAAATLSALVLADANNAPILLAPAPFNPATTAYAATVANAVDAVTLTAPASSPLATVAIAGDDDPGTADVAVLDLAVGTNTLTVTVTAEDGMATVTYTVTVTRLETPPGQVLGVAVVRQPGGLEVVWNQVTDADGYKVQWKSGMETFADAAVQGREATVQGATLTTYRIEQISHLETYAIRVIAIRPGAPDGLPSEEVSGVPARANETPQFTEGASATRTIGEGAAVGTDVGPAVTATDADVGDSLTYSLIGADAFRIDPVTGQIWTHLTLDHETTASHAVTVVARDDSASPNDTATIAIAIDVSDAAEPPSRPAAPAVAAVTRTKLSVTWTEPGLNGGPAITGYTLRHRSRVTDSDTWGSWTEVSSSGIATSKELTGLTGSLQYEVQVKASNGEADSAWSDAGAGATPAGGNAPVCDRTEQVRDAILDKIAGVDDCIDVTAAQLTAITGTLDLSLMEIGSLAQGDFTKLSGITTLNLRDNEIEVARKPK